MRNLFSIKAGTTLFAAACLITITVQADEFTQADLKKWQKEFMVVAEQGEKLFHSGDMGPDGISGNGISCAQCHPNATNVHPETYPKFQQQLGSVAPLRDMINWCIENPLEGESLHANDPRMVALEAYINWERRGVKLEPGRH